MKGLSQTKNFRILEKINQKDKVKRLFEFTIGMLLVSISYNLFLSPNRLVPGGVSGIAIILNGILKIDNSLVILIANLILLLASYLFLGKEKTKGNLLGSLLFPLLVKLTTGITDIIAIDNTQLLLTSLFAGVIYGAGAGIIFKAGYTTGGTDILNQIMSKYLKIGIGKSMLFCDGLIVAISIFVFGINKCMYSIIILYIISVISDKILLGISDSKAFYIITDKEEKIKEYIIDTLGHSVTVFNARGGFTKEKQHVIMCVLPTKEYYHLKEGISKIDSEAFFVVTDAYEVFGGN